MLFIIQSLIIRDYFFNYNCIKIEDGLQKLKSSIRDKISLQLTKKKTGYFYNLG